MPPLVAKAALELPLVEAAALVARLSAPALLLDTGVKGTHKCLWQYASLWWILQAARNTSFSTRCII